MHHTIFNLGKKNSLILMKMTKRKNQFHFFIQNNANLKQTDHEGRTCLTYAKAANELARVKQSNNKPHHVSSGK